MCDDRDNRVRAMDEAAKQIFRNDPELAVRSQAIGYLIFGGIVVVSVIIGLIHKALG